MVVKNLAHELDLKRYYIFNNLTLETSDGLSTQIDHVVVSPYGIFVIETKDYSGWIFGDQFGKVWTQTLPGKNKHTFQNPFRQNYRHIKILQEYLPFVHSTAFKTIIAFSRFSEFKTKKPEAVVYIDQVVDYIKNFKDSVINKAVFFMVIGKLSQLCQSTDISPGKHKLNLKSSHLSKNVK
ncbi:NERD domain-containing protein [Patescibacteria group bacterium]|nr:NERD domain-containing protein [Patescibacteria group bacterium]